MITKDDDHFLTYLLTIADTLVENEEFFIHFGCLLPKKVTRVGSPAAGLTEFVSHHVGTGN